MHPKMKKIREGLGKSSEAKEHGSPDQPKGYFMITQKVE